MTIKDAHSAETLREHMIQNGTAALTDADLLGLILGGPKRRGGGDEVAALLLEGFGSLRRMARASTIELSKQRGLGPARASRLKAAFELANRMAQEKRQVQPRFLSSQQIFDYVHLDLRDLCFEVFEIFLLDARNRLIRKIRVSRGTLTASLVHPREVFRPAVLEGAAALVLIHNHPSGDPTPSREDMDITERLVSAGKIVGIKVLDHLVVGDGRYVSMADLGGIIEI